MLTTQLRLPFPRGNRVSITCGHPDKRHYARGMCSPCYFKQYRYDHPVECATAVEKYRAKKRVAKAFVKVEYRPIEEDLDWNLPEEIGLRYME